MGQNIAEKIRTIRTLRRLTQENVADEIRITHGAYAKIERGETDPNTSRLQDIARILKVNIADFFSDKEPNIKEDKNPYGYASKADVDNLSHLVQNLVKEVERLRAELPKTSAKKKSRAK